MSDTSYIHIRNWDLYQHPDVTRNRKHGAPWIKDYTAQDDDDDYRSLTLAEQGLLHCLRRAYARRKGRGMPSDTRSISGIVAAQVTRKQLERLNHAGFIVFSASKVASDSASKVACPEVEVDVEGEEEVEEPFNQGLTVVSNDTKGPDHENLKNQEGHHAGQPNGHLRPHQEDADGPQPDATTHHGPLRDAVLTELAKTKSVWAS